MPCAHSALRFKTTVLFDTLTPCFLLLPQACTLTLPLQSFCKLTPNHLPFRSRYLNHLSQPHLTTSDTPSTHLTIVCSVLSKACISSIFQKLLKWQSQRAEEEQEDIGVNVPDVTCTLLGLRAEWAQDRTKWGG